MSKDEIIVKLVDIFFSEFVDNGEDTIIVINDYTFKQIFEGVMTEDFNAISLRKRLFLFNYLDNFRFSNEIPDFCYQITGKRKVKYLTF